MKKTAYINSAEKVKAEEVLLGAILREPYNLHLFLDQIPKEALQTSEYAASFAEMYQQYSERGTFSAATVESKTFQPLSLIAQNNAEIDLSWAVSNWWFTYQVWAEQQAALFSQAPGVLIEGADAIRAEQERVRIELGVIKSVEAEYYKQEFAKDAFDKLEGKERVYKTTLHINSIRSIFKAFKPGYLTLIAGRPGMGKTQFALNLYSHFLDNGANGPFFTLEMSPTDLLNRLIGIRHGINPQGDWSMIDKAKVEKAIHEVAALDTNIFSKCFTIASIEAKCTSLFHAGQLEFIMIDYLQLIKSAQKEQNREREVSIISGALVMMAKRFNVPVIALSQFSRDVEKRGGAKRPQLSDLRDSGSLEQDAANVIFLHRPEYYGILEDESGNSTKGIAEVIVAKHRNGPCDTAFCEYNPIRGYVNPKAETRDFVPVDYTEPVRIDRADISKDVPF